MRCGQIQSARLLCNPFPNESMLNVSPSVFKQINVWITKMTWMIKYHFIRILAVLLCRALSMACKCGNIPFIVNFKQVHLLALANERSGKKRFAWIYSSQQRLKASRNGSSAYYLVIWLHAHQRQANHETPSLKLLRHKFCLITATEQEQRANHFGWNSQNSWWLLEILLSLLFTDVQYI